MSLLCNFCSTCVCVFVPLCFPVGKARVSCFSSSPPFPPCSKAEPWMGLSFSFCGSGRKNLNWNLLLFFQREKALIKRQQPHKSVQWRPLVMTRTGLTSGKKNNQIHWKWRLMKKCCLSEEWDCQLKSERYSNGARSCSDNEFEKGEKAEQKGSFFIPFRRYHRAGQTVAEVKMGLCAPVHPLWPRWWHPSVGVVSKIVALCRFACPPSPRLAPMTADRWWRHPGKKLKEHRSEKRDGGAREKTGGLLLLEYDRLSGRAKFWTRGEKKPKKLQHPLKWTIIDTQIRHSEGDTCRPLVLLPRCEYWDKNLNQSSYILHYANYWTIQCEWRLGVGWGGGRGARARSLDASQWAGWSVFKGNVVFLTGAPRGRHAAVGLIRKKKFSWEGDDEGWLNGPFQK